MGDFCLILLKIKLIFVNNNQKYFSFNTLYGKAKDNYTITDPIVRVINPEITESLFWGNILTSDGGLFFDQKHTSNQNFFNQINPYIKEFNLENIINFSYSVFQETGELLSQKKVNKLNAYLQVKSRLLCKMLYNVFTISTYQN